VGSFAAGWVPNVVLVLVDVVAEVRATVIDSSESGVGSLAIEMVLVDDEGGVEVGVVNMERYKMGLGREWSEADGNALDNHSRARYSTTTCQDRHSRSGW